MEAGILFELRYNLSAGHAFLPEEKLIAATAQLLNIEAASVTEGIERLMEGQRLVRDHLAGITVLYLPQLHEAETYCTHRLLSFAASHIPEPQGLEKMLRFAQKEGGIEYSAQQTAAIRAAATEQVLLVTGGPGTGKTTILNGILSLLGQMQLSCLLAAPTGRAARRLTTSSISRTRRSISSLGTFFRRRPKATLS